jgi:diguanylate cyclase (GGDEF)-like protein
VTAIGGLIATALLCLVAVLLQSSWSTRESFAWVSHSQQVIVVLDEALEELREAESGQRGYLLTHDERFATNVDQRLSDVLRQLDRLVRLTSDNALQNERAIAVRDAGSRKVAFTRESMRLARRGDFVVAVRGIAAGRGRELMAQVDRQAGALLQRERDLLAQRAYEADERLAWTKYVALGGGLLVAALLASLIATMSLGVRRPLGRTLEAMEALGRGQVEQRLIARTGSDEFDRLASGYNRMADRLAQAVDDQRETDSRLQAANADLLAQHGALEARGQVIERLGEMAHRLQAARTDGELAQIIDCFVPQVLPGVAGALYAHNNSRNLLVRLAGWGVSDALPENFGPDDCWALRLGQGHVVLGDGREVPCRHAVADAGAYRCEPLLAGGEVIGLLFLQGVIGSEEAFRLAALGENIASALVNHRLQRDLKEQTVRDALTGLHNRRYMEEALHLEIARAARTGAPLTFVMCDIDHFKRFNDEFGHDAGDTVLQLVGAAMRDHFRDGDVACRFGGEEFAIIAPGASAEVLLPRIERLRANIADLRPRQGTKLLGPISLSFGISEWHPPFGRENAPLIADADAALYRAKRAGRDRAIVAERLAA